MKATRELLPPAMGKDVIVIGHDAIGQHLELRAIAESPEKRNKLVVIGLGAEKLQALRRAVHDMPCSRPIPGS
jgi:hypothetical protein